MNEKVFNYLLGFAAFSILLAARDFLYRLVMVNGTPLMLTLFVSGVACLVFAFLVSIAFRIPLRPKDFKYQGIRLVNGAFVYILILLSLKHLNATSVAIISKAYLPILILMGPFLSTSYTKQQKVFALLSLFTMLTFMFINRDPAEPLLGYLYLYGAITVVIIEYIMLRHSTIKESSFVVAATPALACTIVGAVGVGLSGGIPTLSTNLWLITILSGVAFYGVYFASIYRYRVLPLGLSEYPALITALLILPAEYLAFGWFPSWLYLANLLITMSLLGYCLYLNYSEKMKAQATAGQKA